MRPFPREQKQRRAGGCVTARMQQSELSVGIRSSCGGVFKGAPHQNTPKCIAEGCEKHAQHLIKRCSQLKPAQVYLLTHSQDKIVRHKYSSDIFDVKKTVRSQQQLSLY